MLKAILGEDPFEQKRREILAQKERLESQVHQVVLDILRQEVVGQDPEVTYKANEPLAKAVERRVSEYYCAAYTHQLDFLQRLEATG